MVCKATSEGFKSHQLGRSHINPMQQRVGRKSHQLGKSHIKISKSQWHTGFQGMLLYLQKWRKHCAHWGIHICLNMFKLCFQRIYLEITHGTRPPRSLTLFPNKHRFPCNSYGQHHHINNVKIWKPSGTPLSTSASAWMFHKFCLLNNPSNKELSKSIRNTARTQVWYDFRSIDTT